MESVKDESLVDKENELVRNAIDGLMTDGYAHQASPEVEDAILVAADLHDGQHRISDGVKVPYFLHPLAVAEKAKDFSYADDEVVIAAVLHDTVEDCAPKIIPGHLHPEERRKQAVDAIRKNWGKRVANAVDKLSNDPPEKGVSKQQSRKHYQDHVYQSVMKGSDPIVFIVKFSDFLDNAGRIDPTFPQRARHFYAKYHPLVRTFRKALSKFSKVASDKADYASIEKELDRVEADLQRVHDLIF